METLVIALKNRYLSDGQNIIWQNPQSTANELSIILPKETKEFNTAEINNVLKEVSQLIPTPIRVGESQITVKHDIIFSMIKRKVCNALIGTHYKQKCYICGATPKIKRLSC